MTTESTGSAGGADDLDLFESEATTGTTRSTTQTPTIPDKYVGKTVEDLINMHQNAERKLGQQGQEIGTLRRLTDEVIGLKKPTTQTTEERKPVTVETLLNDPEKAIRDAVANSDVGTRLAATEQRNAQLESQLTERDFSARFTTWGSDVNDPAFIAWVNKQPIRQALATQLTAKKDFTAATNLWEMWEEHKELVSGKQTDETKIQQPQGSKKVPVTVKSSPNSSAPAKPVYSRAKVMEFKMKVQQGDPAALAKWNDPTFQTNLNDAYAENRVK